METGWAKGPPSAEQRGRFRRQGQLVAEPRGRGARAGSCGRVSPQGGQEDLAARRDAGVSCVLSPAMGWPVWLLAYSEGWRALQELGWSLVRERPSWGCSCVCPNIPLL